MCGKNTATFGAYFVQYTYNNSASSNMLILCIFGSMLVHLKALMPRGFSIKDQSIDAIAFFVRYFFWHNFLEKVQSGQDLALILLRL